MKRGTGEKVVNGVT